ncbi:SAM-dependent methyltransferase [Candidatus Methylobacter oryzae]|uniref:SAM-dependent methyltransferase n=1 Tax=Candidatus Methylobacter oryzae TaxID=2497749 RepID=A0ABY3C9W5_9GAMM|nr:SAM-dependent methyltransferase [Candidatus Methylobacter oryzae]TRW94525.1 SAM-dependent methyltransferase [Candidatus Methylobacter oryzae]
MKTDFKNAYVRHQKDANDLFNNKRYANADHLYGLAAECALKAVMIGLDPSLVDENGDLLNQGDKIHINKLWQHFGFFLQNRVASPYLAHLSPRNNPFNNWNVNSRYVHEKYFVKNNTLPHQAAVNNNISNLIATAIGNGIL